MKISSANLSSGIKSTDALVVGVHKGGTPRSLGLKTGYIDHVLDKSISEQWKEFRGAFRGDIGETLYFTTRYDKFKGKIVVVGLGEEDKYDLTALRKAVSAGIREASGRLKANDISLALSPPRGIDIDYASQTATEVAKLATYEFLEYKSDPKPKYEINELTIVHDSSKNTVKKGIERGEIFANAQILARDLVNTPAGDLTPANFADRAREVAKSIGLSDIEIFGKREIEKHDMQGLLAVSAGSSNEPRFVVIRYRPEGAKEHIALVGKGVTFDSGGLNIKPADGMMDMKCDKGGASAVLGTMSAITRLNPKVNITFIMPLTENMTGGYAFKQGDVVKVGGQTFEIHNTDAEGRVILSNGLNWAVEQEKADKIFDYATLTGACMVALGEDRTGIMTNDDALANDIIQASKYTGEKMWQLPLDDSDRDKITGKVADFNNLGKNRYGGAITAAAFLEKFVGKTPWVHHDIAGPAFREAPDELGPAGATGVPVRTNLFYLSESYPG